MGTERVERLDQQTNPYLVHVRVQIDDDRGTWEGHKILDLSDGSPIARVLDPGKLRRMRRDIVGVATRAAKARAQRAMRAA